MEHRLAAVRAGVEHGAVAGARLPRRAPMRGQQSIPRPSHRASGAQLGQSIAMCSPGDHQHVSRRLRSDVAEMREHRRVGVDCFADGICTRGDLAEQAVGHIELSGWWAGKQVDHNNAGRSVRLRITGTSTSGSGPSPRCSSTPRMPTPRAPSTSCAGCRPPSPLRAAVDARLTSAASKMLRVRLHVAVLGRRHRGEISPCRSKCSWNASRQRCELEMRPTEPARRASRSTGSTSS